MKKLILLLVLTSQLAFSQSSIVHETLEVIEFKEDTIKSVFNWITDNIKYDVNKLKQIESGQIAKKNSNFKTEKEYIEHLLKSVIRHKKGVCEDYSLLFHTLADALGYESYIVVGYTKEEEGKLNRTVGHTWNAIRLEGDWKLFDPTWGSGHLKDDKKFVREYSEEWFDVTPEVMIKTHMPFDPIWQLTEKPLSYTDFNEGERSSFEGEYDYASLIEQHLRSNKKVQMQGQIDRSQTMGQSMRLIDKWRHNLSKNIGLYGITSQKDLLEEASDNSDKAVDYYNAYVNAKNKQFKGKKWTKDIAKENLDLAKNEIHSALSIFKNIEVEDKRASSSILKATRHCEKLLSNINREIEFLEKLNRN